MLIKGKCHCGNIAFELEWEGNPPEIPARACGCTFCVKHGGVWTSNPKAKLAVSVRDAALEQRPDCHVSRLLAVRRRAAGDQRDRKPSLCGRQRQRVRKCR